MVQQGVAQLGEVVGGGDRWYNREVLGTTVGEHSTVECIESNSGGSTVLWGGGGV